MRARSLADSDLVYELPNKLPDDFRLRILGDLEISEKFQNWAGAA